MATGQLSEQTEQHLQEILSREEFQPRGNSPAWYESIWESISRSIYEQLRSVLEQLEGWDIDRDTDFWLLRWLSELADWLSIALDYLLIFFRYAGYALAVAVFALVAYFLYRHFTGTNNSSARSRQKPAEFKPEPEDSTSPLEYLSKGQSRLALVRLRGVLREKLAKALPNFSSLTDYELQKRLDPSRKSAQLFGEVSKKFERVFFAGDQLLDEEIRRLCQLYTVLEEQREV